MRVTDPVCGAQFDTEKAVAQEVFGNQTYFFCSAQCHQLFKTSPERYVSRVKQSGGESGAKEPDRHSHE